ncbi:adhesive plaque matrix protein 2-like [Mytilus edulis]|uniref:adhesive plaque matrix protein 2-like n=1 Tax=Mytilus edulis TaxID=6550 RepID=UPI0039F12C5B
MTNLTVLTLDLHCDCNILPFWNWLNLVEKYETTITCINYPGLSSIQKLPTCAFDKCPVCSNNFCTNGGTCFVNSFGDLSCLCPGDWTGAKCNVNPCHNKPCGNNGVCEVDIDEQAVCQCNGNWTGKFCEKSPCETRVCSQNMCYYNDTGVTICINEQDTQCIGKYI